MRGKKKDLTQGQKNVVTKTTHAVIELSEKGLTTTEIAEVTKLPDTTVQKILDNRAVIKDRAELIKEVLGDIWYNLSYKALEALEAKGFEKANYKDLATIAGIATDKARLLEGKPTDIVAQYKMVIEKYVKEDTRSEPDA